MQDLNSCIQPSYIYHRLCFLEYSHSWSMIGSAVHFSYLRLLSSCICQRFCSSASSRIFQHLCHFCKQEERVTIFGDDHACLGACVWINPQQLLGENYVIVAGCDPGNHSAMKEWGRPLGKNGMNWKVFFILINSGPLQRADPL